MFSADPQQQILLKFIKESRFYHVTRLCQLRQLVLATRTQVHVRVNVLDKVAQELLLLWVASVICRQSSLYHCSIFIQQPWWGSTFSLWLHLWSSTWLVTQQCHANTQSLCFAFTYALMECNVILHFFDQRHKIRHSTELRYVHFLHVLYVEHIWLYNMEVMFICLFYLCNYVTNCCGVLCLMPPSRYGTCWLFWPLPI